MVKINLFDSFETPNSSQRTDSFIRGSLIDSILNLKRIAEERIRREEEERRRREEEERKRQEAIRLAAQAAKERLQTMVAPYEQAKKILRETPRLHIPKELPKPRAEQRFMPSIIPGTKSKAIIYDTPIDEAKLKAKISLAEKLGLSSEALHDSSLDLRKRAQQDYVKKHNMLPNQAEVGSFSRYQWLVGQQLNEFKKTFGFMPERDSSLWNSAEVTAKNKWIKELKELSPEEVQETLDKVYGIDKWISKANLDVGIGKAAEQVYNNFRDTKYSPYLRKEEDEPIPPATKLDDLKRYTVDLLSEVIRTENPDIPEDQVKKFAIDGMAEGISSLRAYLNLRGIPLDEADVYIAMEIRRTQLQEEARQSLRGWEFGADLPLNIQGEIDKRLEDEFEPFLSKDVSAPSILGSEFLGKTVSSITKSIIEPLSSLEVLPVYDRRAGKIRLISYNEAHLEAQTRMADPAAQAILNVVSEAARQGELGFEKVTGLPAEGKVSDPIKENEIAKMLLSEGFNPTNWPLMAPFARVATAGKTGAKLFAQIFLNIAGPLGGAETAAPSILKGLARASYKGPAAMARIIASAPANTKKALFLLQSFKRPTVLLSEETISLLDKAKAGEKISVKEAIKALEREAIYAGGTQRLFSSKVAAENAVDALRLRQRYLSTIKTGEEALGVAPTIKETARGFDAAQTGKPFEAFTYRAEAIKPTGARRLTTSYARYKYMAVPEGRGPIDIKVGDAKLIKSKVSLDNPLVVDGVQGELLDAWAKQGDEAAKKLISEVDVADRPPKGWYKRADDYIAKRAASLGHDGIVYKAGRRTEVSIIRQDVVPVSKKGPIEFEAVETGIKVTPDEEAVAALETLRQRGYTVIKDNDMWKFTSPEGRVFTKSDGDIFIPATKGMEQGLYVQSTDNLLRPIKEFKDKTKTLYYVSHSDDIESFLPSGALKPGKVLLADKDFAVSEAQYLVQRRGGEPIVYAVEVPEKNISPMAGFGDFVQTSDIPLPATDISKISTKSKRYAAPRVIRTTPEEAYEKWINKDLNPAQVQTRGKELIEEAVTYNPGDEIDAATRSLLQGVQESPIIDYLYKGYVLSPEDYDNFITPFREAKATNGTITLGPTSTTRSKEEALRIVNRDEVTARLQFGKKNQQKIIIAIKDSKAVNIEKVGGATDIAGIEQEMLTAGKFKVDKIGRSKNSTFITLTPVEEGQIFRAVDDFGIIRTTSDKAQAFEQFTKDIQDIAAGIYRGDEVLPPLKNLKSPLKRPPDPIGIEGFGKIKSYAIAIEDQTTDIDNMVGGLARFLDGNVPGLGAITRWINPSAIDVLKGSKELTAKFFGYLHKEKEINYLISTIETSMYEAEKRIYKVKDNLVYVKRNMPGKLGKQWLRVETVDPISKWLPTPEMLVNHPEYFHLNNRELQFVKYTRRVLDSNRQMEIAKGIRLKERAEYFPHKELSQAPDAETKARLIFAEAQSQKADFGTEKWFQKDRSFETMQARMEVENVSFGDSFTYPVMARVQSGQLSMLDKEVVELIANKTDRVLLRGAISEFKAEKAGALLDKLEQINNVIRPTVTLMDMGYMGLQMAMLTARNPVAGARGMLMAFDALVTDGRLMSSYLRKNQDWLPRFFNAGGMWNQIETSFEFAAQRGGKFGQWLGKGVPGRFSASYAHALNVGTLETFKGMVGVNDAIAKLFGINVANRLVTKALGGFLTGEDVSLTKGVKKGSIAERQIAAVANKLSLRTESTILGISRGQRAAEGALFFAPRYYRAFFGLLGDTMRLGMRGAEARRSFGQFFIGLAALDYAIQLASGEDIEWNPLGEKGLQLDPFSKHFGTKEFGPIRVGVGGPFISIVGGVGRILETPSKWGEEGTVAGIFKPTITELDLSENPIFRELWKKSSPVNGIILDLLNRETVMGEELDFNDPMSAFEYLERKFTPFWVSGAHEIYKETGNLPAVIGAGLTEFFAGARTYPESQYDRFKEDFGNKYSTAVEADARFQLRSEGKAITQETIDELKDYNPENPYHRDLIKNDPELSKRLTEIKEKFIDPETDLMTKLKNDEDTQLSELAYRILNNDPQAAQDWADAIQNQFERNDALRKGSSQDFPEPKTAIGKLVDEYWAIDAGSAKYKVDDPEKGDFDRDRYKADKEAVLAKMLPEVADSLRNRDRFHWDHINEADKRYLAAQEKYRVFKDDWFPKYKGVISEQEEKRVDNIKEKIKKALEIARYNDVKFRNPKTGRLIELTKEELYRRLANGFAMLGDKEYSKVIRIAFLSDNVLTKDEMKSTAKADYILANSDLAWFYTSAWRYLTVPQRLEWQRLYEKKYGGKLPKDLIYEDEEYP